KSRLRSSSKCSMSVTTLRPDGSYALGALAVPAGGLRRLGGGLSSALRRCCRDGRGLDGLVILLDVLAHVPDPLAELADGLAETLGHVGQAPRPEDAQDQHEDDQQLHDSYGPDLGHRCLRPDASRTCQGLAGSGEHDATTIGPEPQAEVLTSAASGDRGQALAWRAGFRDIPVLDGLDSGRSDMLL